MKASRCCPGGHLQRVARTSFGDYALSYAGFLPYHCDTCKRRALVADRGWLALLCLALVMTAGAGGAALRLRSRRAGMSLPPVVPASEDSRRQLDEVLTNEGIARMGRAQISPVVLKKLIHAEPHHFLIDPESLVALKKSGVPDDVILEIVELTLEAPPPAPRPASPSPGSVLASN